MGPVHYFGGAGGTHLHVFPKISLGRGGGGGELVHSFVRPNLSILLFQYIGVGVYYDTLLNTVHNDLS